MKKKGDTAYYAEVDFMANQNLKENRVRIGGRVVYKNYRASDQTLFVVIYTSVVRRNRSNADDSPAIIFHGEMAEKLNAVIPDNRQLRGRNGSRIYIDVKGHITMEERFEPVPKQRNMFQRRRYPVVIGDSYEIAEKGEMVAVQNRVILSGKITRVFKYEEINKRYYMITMDVGNGRIMFFYFDHDLSTNPEEGSYATVYGSVRTRMFENEGRRPGHHTVQSIVAKVLELDSDSDRSDSDEEEDTDPEITV